MRIRRLMQLLLTGTFSLITLAMIAGSFAAKPKAHSAILGMAVIFSAITILMFTMFQIQFRSVRKAAERVRVSLGPIAAKLFDAPVPVLEHYDGAPLLSIWGGMSRTVDGDTWSAAEGDFRGGKLLFASHPSVMGRQLFEMCHVYSYVVIDVPGVNRPFSITEEAGAFGNLFAGASEAPRFDTGDPAFQKAWVVNSDPDLAQRVLDDSVRQRLLELRAQVRKVSQNIAQGRMSIRLGYRGLIVRWPGELDASFAAWVRDLLFDMRAKMMS